MGSGLHIVLQWQAELLNIQLRGNGRLRQACKSTSAVPQEVRKLTICKEPVFYCKFLSEEDKL